MPLAEDGALVLASSDSQASLRLSPLGQYGRCVAEVERVGKLHARQDEPGFEVRCTHDGLGHVTCVVSLISTYEDWSAVVRIMLDAGGLDDLARDVRKWESAAVPGTGE